jgi:N-hydroxyarylamine O-acetyltransferase
LTVRCAGESWFVDAGLGDALHEPIPLRTGEYRQGPFTYGLAPWQGEGQGDGWRFTHALAASFISMVFTMAPVSMEAFAEAHERLSTSPDSSFVKALSVGRRDADGFDVLRGRVLTRIDSAGKRSRTVENAPDWYACLAEVFDLPLDDVDAAAREKLWARVSAAHEVWLAGESGDDQAVGVNPASTAGTRS